MKKIILPIAALTLGMTAATTAVADVTVYGRVLYNAVSDDTSDDLYFGRHEFAESNFGIKGTKKVGDLVYGGQVELGLNEGVSSLLQNGSNSRNRIQQMWIQSAQGKLLLGTGPSITWVISDVDQSGTWLADPLGMSARFGATRRGPSGQSQTPFVQGQSIFNERLRYESPEFLGGAKLYAQLNEDSGTEVAIKYVANGWRFNVWSVDHGEGDNDADPQQNVDGFTTSGFFGAEKGSGALLGYKHSSGFNLTGTTVNADQLAGGDRSLVAVKLGYTKDKHAVSYNIGEYSSENAAGVEGPDHTRSSLAYVYSPTGGVKLWSAFTTGDTDQQDSFNSVAFGGMIKF